MVPPVFSESYLVCRSGDRLCALPLKHVRETMRPLPTQSLAAMPAFLLGAAIIRGVPTPVVSLASLLGEPAQALPTRFVTVHLGARCVALAVDSVIGMRALPIQDMADIPLLLQAMDSGNLSAITVLDAQLLSVLQDVRMVSDAVLDSVDMVGEP